VTREAEAPRRLYHRLVVAADRARRRIDVESLDRAGVTTAQAAALFALDSAPGQTQRQLAEALRIRDPSAAQMVARSGAAHDARAWAVSLTPKGRAALRRLRPALDRMNAWLSDGFTRQELAVVARFLDHVGEDEDG